MIKLSIALFIFMHIVRYSELKEYTTVRNFNDYFIFNDNVVLIYIMIWIFITAMLCL